MSTFSKSTEFQATIAVNSLLSSLLPGAQKISTNGKSKRRNNQKGSTAQLIDRNLKKMVALNELDVSKIRKKERKLRKQENRLKRIDNDKLEQTAKLQLLIKHRAEGTLTASEETYLKRLLKKNESNAKLWDLDDDDKDELKDLQKYILDKATGSGKVARGSKRRRKIKEFKEDIKDSRTALMDRRYPGLTPGLAPVGLSDEESSDDEE